MSRDSILLSGPKRATTSVVDAEVAFRDSKRGVEKGRPGEPGDVKRAPDN